ncbi:hypothetical protein BJX70DRAFT_401927 [Aspergillus crustosus]
MVTGGTGALHSISPVEVQVNGDRALTKSTGSVSTRFTYKGRSYDSVSITRFISRLERVAGQWKLLTLEAIYDRDAITPVLPGATGDSLPDPQTARESYKCISWVLGLRGFEIKPDLPGVDDPESCARLMEESRRWLSGVQ